MVQIADLAFSILFDDVSNGAATAMPEGDTDHFYASTRRVFDRHGSVLPGVIDGAAFVVHVSYGGPDGPLTQGEEADALRVNAWGGEFDSAHFTVGHKSLFNEEGIIIVGGDGIDLEDPNWINPRGPSGLLRLLRRAEDQPPRLFRVSPRGLPSGSIRQALLDARGVSSDNGYKEEPGNSGLVVPGQTELTVVNGYSQSYFRPAS